MESLPWPWFLSTRRSLCSTRTPWLFWLCRYCLADLFPKTVSCLYILLILWHFLRSTLWLSPSQQLATASLIQFGRGLGYTKSRGFNLDTAKKLLPLSLFYNANVSFALASLKGVNIPMYIAIKRLTPLAVLVAGFFSGKGKPSTQVRI